MIGRTGRVACALVYALGGCSSEPTEASASPPKEPPRALYDLERPTAGLPPPQERGPDFRRGIVFGPLKDSEKDSPELRKRYVSALDEIAGVGATDVQLFTYWWQPKATANAITPHPTRTIDDALLAWLMQQATERSLRVFLLPTLLVGEPAGTDSPASVKPSEPDGWFWAYRRFILHYARLAQANDVQLLSVGRELTSMEHHGERWKALIEDVRRLYKRQLTYSARWDHFEPVTFWEALDVVGIAAYPELTGKPGAPDVALRAGLASFAKQLRAWALANERSYVFTEMGYPSQPHAAQAPRELREDATADLAMQLRCYRAFFEVWQDDPRLAGLYARHWALEGGASDAGYSVRDKPSRNVLAHWFRSSTEDSEKPKSAAR